MSATDDDVLKSTIQEYNIKFKFDDRHLEFFLMQIRFLMNILLRIIKHIIQPYIIYG